MPHAALDRRRTPSMPARSARALGLCACAAAVLSIALAARAAPAQEPAAKPAVDPRQEHVSSILRESLVRGQAFAKLQTLCSEYPRRLSGSVDAQNAVQWAKRQMEADGLENVRLEPCKVPVWVRGDIALLAIAEPAALAPTKLSICALGGSVPTSDAAPIEAGVVEVTSFEELTALGDAARGKIVFFDRPMDPAELDPFKAYGGAANQRSRGAIEAAKAGAVAAIVRSLSLRIDDHPHTGAMRYEDGVPKIPAAAISTAGAERLSALLAKNPGMRLTLKLDCRSLPDADSFNVLAEVRGREKPDEIVLIGGHLDGWDLGQGAHDDGAGVAQVMEALRLVKSLGLRPRRTLRLCLFMNEENGLRGGHAYLAAHKDELQKHVMALETDRGGFAPQAFGTDANPAAFEMLRGYTRFFAGTGGDRLVAGSGGADIGELANSGVPLLEYIPDPSRYFDLHHSSRDVLTEVHPRELELGAALIAALAWCVADDATLLPRNVPKSDAAPK
jgi:carboxypeptidase Q